MAQSRKKQCLVTPPPSLVSVTQAQSQEEHSQRRQRTEMVKDFDNACSPFPEQAIRLHQNKLSVCYTHFNPPKSLQQKKDKHRQRKIGYPSVAGTFISQLMTTPHVATCLKKQPEEIDSQKIVAVGVSGTGNINPCDVAQLCAIWCAETAWPCAALGEQAHQGILEMLKLKATRVLLSWRQCHSVWLG
ncbi:hypothetical protein PSTG_06531 [Puccinia striiformis f. sp. tritici PST-78]|uniref:Uncharacterized protein n=1 Tax=Puccinia striiformis f. sp. tritici PST-78 TaxID=1165861 RepID=A0A0L0VLH2_9BASI|nr:hypothetical protein PSTG_06531 [Puccinia striiformis f. sp. tritici PST-78]